MSDSIQQTHPKIAAEWHPTKNDRTPDDVTFGARYEAWWKCGSCGYEWKRRVGSRTSGAGCMNCFRNKLGRENSKWKGYGDISAAYWGKMKTEALKRGHKFRITIKYGWKLFLQQEKKCALTGYPLVMFVPRKSHRVDRTASLDRIDSSKGYVIGNVQWVHKEINRMKWKYTTEQFRQLCADVTAYAVGG